MENVYPNVDPFALAPMAVIAILNEPKPPYPFCSRPQECIAAGRCTRTVNGEPRPCSE